MHFCAYMSPFKCIAPSIFFYILQFLCSKIKVCLLRCETCCLQQESGSSTVTDVEASLMQLKVFNFNLPFNVVLD